MDLPKYYKRKNIQAQMENQIGFLNSFTPLLHDEYISY
jgi:hypothetical protein